MWRICTGAVASKEARRASASRCAVVRDEALAAIETAEVVAAVVADASSGVVATPSGLACALAGLLVRA